MVDSCLPKSLASLALSYPLSGLVSQLLVARVCSLLGPREIVADRGWLALAETNKVDSTGIFDNLAARFASGRVRRQLRASQVAAVRATLSPSLSSGAAPAG